MGRFYPEPICFRHPWRLLMSACNAWNLRVQALDLGVLAQEGLLLSILKLSVAHCSGEGEDAVLRSCQEVTGRGGDITGYSIYGQGNLWKWL